MKRVLLSLSIALLTNLGLTAQTTHSCGFEHYHESLVEANPEFKEQIRVNEENLQRIIAKQKNSRRTETLYTIPVVVHVIHAGEAVGVGNNISDAQINSGITQLNNAFRNTHGQSVDINIQFQLATMDPNCTSTTGINRIDGSVLIDYATMGVERQTTDGARDSLVKDLSTWDRDNYYNFWIVNEIDNNDGGAGVQGYAQLPGGTAISDGTLILNSAWGDQGTAKSYTDEGKTIIHEIGHALDLWHTFQGDDSGNSCPTETDGCYSTGGSGDCISDVPAHIRSSSNCNTSGTNSCDGNSSNELFVHNYMDYASETCQYLFSSDQKTRMRAALESDRASLISSKGLNSTLANYSLTAATCTGVASNKYNSMGVTNVQIVGQLNVSSGSASDDDGYLDRTSSCEALVELYIDSTYTFQTTIVSTSYDQKVRAWIDYNDDGSFAGSEEIFYNASISKSSPTESVSFTVPTTATTSKYLRMRVMADHTSVTITGACDLLTYGETEDYIIYMKTAAVAPVASFSASKTTVCVGESITFTDASTSTPTSWAWTTTGGTPSSSTNQNPSITYSTAGTYSVTLAATNASGTDSEIKTNYITVLAAPIVNLGSDTAICSGSTITLDAGNSGGSYNWFDQANGQTTQTVIASTAGEYHVDVIAIDGCTARDTLVLALNALPVVDLGSDTVSICSGSSLTLDAGNVGLQYLWNTTSTDQTIPVNSAGSYSVIVYNPTGCDGGDTINISLNSLPIVTINDYSVCNGDAATFTVTSDSAVFSYAWSDNGTGTNSTTSGTAAGNYTATITDINGCVASGTGTLTVNSLPVVDLGADTAICSGSTLDLDAGNSGSAYLWWFDSSTNSTLTVSTANSYTVVVVNGNGCMASDTIELTLNTLPTVTVDGNFTVDYDITEGDVTLAFGLPSGGTYSGTGVSAGVFNTATAGNGSHVITYDYTDSNGCSESTSTTLTVSTSTSTAKLNTNNGVAVTPNPFNDQLIITLSGEVAGNSYTMSDNSGKLVLSGNITQSNTAVQTGELTPGVYYLTVNGNSGNTTVKIVKSR